MQDNYGQTGIYYSSPVSDDGRFIVFASLGSNLVANDTNGAPDVFVRDRQTGSTELVSVGPGGVQGDNFSGLSTMCISDDGRFIAFDSSATNLVAGDTNGWGDVFVRDRVAATTERVSVSTLGLQGDFSSSSPSISADGRFVAFRSNAANLVGGDGNNTTDCFVHDRMTGLTERVSVSSSGIEGNDASEAPVISRDGRYVVFISFASNLVAGDTNSALDVFVRDRVASTTVRVSVDTNGLQGTGTSYFGRMSDDGRYVCFNSDAPNLVPGDTNGTTDIFLRDMLTGSLELVAISSTGTQGNGYCLPWSISADNRYITFGSLATNLVSGDTNGCNDCFIRDRLLGTTERLSVSTNSAQDNGYSEGGGMTPDGRYVVFYSDATNLVPGDTNAARDVFLRDRFATGFTSICDPGSGSVLYCPCMNPPTGAGRGCDNSSLTGGASLTASGIAYLSLDSLAFTTSGEKPSATSVLLQGDAAIANGLFFGQGIRCVGGTLKRLFVKTAANGSITAPDFPGGDPTISARSAALGVPIQPGQPYCYLVFYRDATVLGGCSALATFNCTQTGSVSYWP